MRQGLIRAARVWTSFVVTTALVVPVVAFQTPASADLAAPWDGNPISAGLGPTYGEEWCEAQSPGRARRASRIRRWP